MRPCFALTYSAGGEVLIWQAITDDVALDRQVPQLQTHIDRVFAVGSLAQVASDAGGL